MNKATGFACLLILLAAITGCGTTASQKTDATPQKPTAKGLVIVFAAASTTNALNEIKAAFTERMGTEVQTSYAASSTLAQQMVNGAEADLFISADVKWADHVEGKMPVTKRRNLLGNRLVIVVPSDSNLKVAKPEDLLSDKVKHLALGDPDAVPVGRYAKQALTKLGIWEKLKGKVVPAEDVRQALTYVEAGAADAGIVYATDAAISVKARVAVEIPADLTEPVRYPVLLLRRETENTTAEAFYDYLGSPEATEVFERFGFVILADSGDGRK
jgi:molybdate transport system substrate-binding protein